MLDVVITLLQSLLSSRQMLLIPIALGFGFLLTMAYKIVRSYFETQSFRETILHWASSFLAAVLFLGTGIAVGVVLAENYFLSMLLPFIIPTGLLLWRATRRWLSLYRLPDDALVVGIVPFEPTSNAAEEDARNIQSAVTEKLENQRVPGDVLIWRLLRGPLFDAPREAKRSEAQRRGNSVLDGRCHIVVYAKVGVYGGEIRWDSEIIVINPLLGKTANEARSSQFTAAEPQRLELRDLAAARTADLITLLRGLAHFKGGKWDEAIKWLDLTDLPEALFYKALSYHERGSRLCSPEGDLGAAIDGWRRILEDTSRDSDPQRWAMTQNNLGNTLQVLGTRVDGKKEIRYLKDAVIAYKRALEVFAHQHSLQHWAMTQNNLGNAEQELGTRAVGKIGIRHLGNAVVAYNRALGVFMRQDLPQRWAMTQNNLGNALQELAKRVDGEERFRYLKDAVVSYNRASRVYTRSKSPERWAITRNNLGAALRGLGIRTDGKEGIKHLRHARTAFTDALEVFSRHRSPHEWAMALNNLGTTLSELGTRADGKEGIKLLADALAAYDSALGWYIEKRVKSPITVLALPHDSAIGNLEVITITRSEGLKLACICEHIDSGLHLEHSRGLRQDTQGFSSRSDLVVQRNKAVALDVLVKKQNQTTHGEVHRPQAR
jgi:tetratricopeptide (TPR) repeat protein